MNHTEAEARRLLAAATEDMPPGIDLLAGFETARRRARTRRTRGRAVLSAGVAMVAAAAAAITLTIGSAPPALATVTSALSHTLSDSYHLTETDSSYYIWNRRITDRYQHTCTTEADPARQLAETSCSNGFGAYLQVGGYVYMYIYDPIGEHGRHWQKTRIPSTPGPFNPINSATTATPRQMLAAIEKADKVTVVGPVSGPGWTGTRYSFSGSQGPELRVSGTLDVDQQGRARNLVFTTRMTSQINVFVMTQDLKFSDFGVQVTVTPPPADQTFTGP